jgi:hypothetical protein
MHHAEFGRAALYLAIQTGSSAVQYAGLMRNNYVAALNRGNGCKGCSYPLTAALIQKPVCSDLFLIYRVPLASLGGVE